MSVVTPEDTFVSGQVVPAAQIRWEGDQCVSLDHDDRYFSPDGQREVERVFMAPVELSGRFAATTGTFTVGELGFGTGLNLATLAAEFLARAPASARLHFISLERRPLDGRMLHTMAELWQARLPILSELAASYPPRLSGWHRLHLAGGRVCLSLFFGSASAGLADIMHRQQLPVDHWLLDGFTPPKNPSLWRPALFQQIAQLSAAGTSIATYSAVGAIRRALADVGFAMRKVDQMPVKLHSLAGEFSLQPSARFQPPGSIQVLGGGIAGCSIARALADRGLAVTLVEPSGRLASHASRIPAAVLHGRLRDDGSPEAAWQALSYHYSHQQLQQYPGYQPKGVRQITGPNAAPERLAAIHDRYAPSGSWLTASEQPDTHWRDSVAAIDFAIGGVVHGPTLCRALSTHPLITLSQTRIPAAMTVLASGIASRDHPAASYLEIAALGGQAELCTTPNPPPIAIVGAGYIAPCRGGMVIGSTYEYRDWQPAEAVAANLAPWRNSGRHRGSFRGTRTITSDRVAIVGQLFDRELAPVPGLRISTGFGSTGMSSAPFAAECIAAELGGEFAPIAGDLATALSSLRFRHRQARRGPRMDAIP